MTKRQLRKLIREEIQKLNEVSEKIVKDALTSLDVDALEQIEKKNPNISIRFDKSPMLWDISEIISTLRNRNGLENKKHLKSEIKNMKKISIE